MDDISKIQDVALKELCEYRKSKEEYYKDPRVCLYSHDENSTSKMIPIYGDVFGLSYGEHHFTFTILSLVDVFEDRIHRAYIQMLTSKSDCVASSEKYKNIKRVYIPLILSYPRFSSGVWVKTKGVRHFTEGKTLSHPLCKPHNVFNYSDSDIIFLVIDEICER